MADCAPVVAGLIVPADEHTVITLVVDDSEDDALTAAIAEAETVPSERFGGMLARSPVSC